MSISDIKERDGTKPLPAKVKSAFQHYLAVKIIKSTLPCKSIQVDTGGPQKLTLAPITVARKGSEHVSKRTIQKRSVEKHILQVISGNSYAAVITQTSHIVKSFDVSERE